MKPTRVTDNVGLVGIDASEYPDEQTEHVTTVATDILQDGIDILDTLGWSEVDVCFVEPSDDDADYPMLMLRPPRKSLFGEEQAAICVAPRTESSRGEMDE